MVLVGVLCEPCRRLQSWLSANWNALKRQSLQASDIEGDLPEQFRTHHNSGPELEASFWAGFHLCTHRFYGLVREGYSNPLADSPPPPDIGKGNLERISRGTPICVKATGHTFEGNSASTFLATLFCRLDAEAEPAPNEWHPRLSTQNLHQHWRPYSTPKYLYPAQVVLHFAYVMSFVARSCAGRIRALVSLVSGPDRWKSSNQSSPSMN